MHYGKYYILVHHWTQLTNGGAKRPCSVSVELSRENNFIISAHAVALEATSGAQWRRRFTHIMACASFSLCFVHEQRGVADHGTHCTHHGGSCVPWTYTHRTSNRVPLEVFCDHILPSSAPNVPHSSMYDV